MLDNLSHLVLFPELFADKIQFNFYTKKNSVKLFSIVTNHKAILSANQKIAKKIQFNHPCAVIWLSCLGFINELCQ